MKKICEFLNCKEEGIYPAPRSRKDITNYKYYCIEHIRDFNKSWNFFEGLTEEQFENVVGRISFFVNSGIKFITEMCKMRAFVSLWDEITKERYNVKDPKNRRFRYGMQVNSLGLTEQQPENNVYRILIEMLGVVLSKDARARAVQLPAWNEAMGLPRPWDQQWSLRLQQIVAYETDLLHFDDIFNGSEVVDKKVKKLKESAMKQFNHIQSIGGAVTAVESGYLKQELVNSQKERLERINSKEQIVVGVNEYIETEESPLVSNDGGIETCLLYTSDAADE